VLLSKDDKRLIWSYIKRQVGNTCDRAGRFILPKDQRRADAEQKEFDESSPDSWQRRSQQIRHYNYDMPWGAACVMQGMPITDIEDTCFDLEDRVMNQPAADLLATLPITRPKS